MTERGKCRKAGAYRSRNAALLALAGVRLRRAGHEQSAHFCGACQQWHLSSLPATKDGIRGSRRAPR